MFTGLVEKVGRVARWERDSQGRTLWVTHDPWQPSLAVGESVAVQGVCLTVTRAASGAFACDVLDETLARTNLGTKHEQAPLNLERALRATDRLGGHIVAGHVDGTGTARAVRREGLDRVIAVEAGDALMRYIAMKGSVACDGVSLTVAAVAATGFEVHVIPHTWEHTSLGVLVPGDTVNIETDIMARYVERLDGGAVASASRVDLDLLRRAGYV